MEIINQLGNLPLEDDDMQTNETLLVQNKEKALEAKLKELQLWKSEKVYKEVPDQGQDCISLRWVIKEKLVGSKRFIKAKLCARGFEEEQNFRTDSLTCFF